MASKDVETFIKDAATMEVASSDERRCLRPTLLLNLVFEDLIRGFTKLYSAASEVEILIFVNNQACAEDPPIRHNNA